MQWIIDNQDGRRNLTKIERILVVEKYREKLREEAKERQKEFKGNQYTKVESTPKGDISKTSRTSKELAKLAKVGSGTMARYEYVIQWMVETQLGRRNLSPLQRVQIAEKYRSVFVKKAEENKKIAMEKARTENPNNQGEQFLPKSATTVTPINTRDELAKIAEVGHDTYGKAKKIIDLEDSMTSVNAGLKTS